MKERKTSVSGHAITLLAAAILFLGTILQLEAQTWDDTGATDASGAWNDSTSWTGGIVPNAAGAIVNFTDPDGFVDDNIQVGLGGTTITLGVLNFEDFQTGDLSSTAANAADFNDARIGESDLIFNAGTFIFDNSGSTPEINFLNADQGFDGFIRFNAIIDGVDGLNINTSGNVILDGANTYQGLTTVTYPAGATGPPSNGGSQRVSLEDATGLGATGPGNETLIIADGAAEGGLNNRLETSLRVGGEPIVDPIAEDITFRYLPRPQSDSTFTGFNYDDIIFADSNRSEYNFTGNFVLERQAEVNPQLRNVGWEFQSGDTGTAANPAIDNNTEVLRIASVEFNDESGISPTTAGWNGRFEGQLRLNAVNGPSTDPGDYDDSVGSKIYIGSILEDGDFADTLTPFNKGTADDSTTDLGNRDFGVFQLGDGTHYYQGANTFEGGFTILRGTGIIDHTQAVQNAWFVRLGGGGTVGPVDAIDNGNAFPDVMQLFFNTGGTIRVGPNDQRPLQLDDIVGNPAAANPDLDLGNELPYIIGTIATGETTILDYSDLTYNGDGWNNSNFTEELDALDVTLELRAVADAKLELQGRFQGQFITGDAITGGGLDPIADLGTVTVNKTGAGTVIHWQQNGASQYSGPTNVLEGTLLNRGTNQKTTAVAVSSGATFGGTGVLGDVTDIDSTLVGQLYDGIDNDGDMNIDEIDEASNGNPADGDGNPLGGIGNATNMNAAQAGRVRPKVNVAVTFADMANLMVGNCDAPTGDFLSGALNVEGSVTFAGNNTLSFVVGGANNNANRSILNVNNVNMAAAPNGTVTFTGTESFVFMANPVNPIAAGTYTVMTTDNGHNFEAAFGGPTVAATGPGAFTYTVRVPGNANNLVVDVVSTSSDTDGDGIDDVVEAAFDTDPNNPLSGSEGMPFVVDNGTTQVLRWRQLNTPGATTYTPEQSTDLGDTDPWTTIPGSPAASLDQSAGTPNTTVFELQIDSGLPANFGRVRIGP